MITDIINDCLGQESLVYSGVIQVKRNSKKVDDFDDSFVYWINKETYLIEYLAYSYSTDGGGKRFRVMINPRDVNRLKIVDYINYEPKDLDVPIEEYNRYYEEGGLHELSRIENENVKVTYLE